MNTDIYHAWKEQLNPEQQKAVETLSGPVLVVAGPGTGKTQLLATRIAHMLHTGYAEPQNILCLTYTNAGRFAMRKRLAKVIGAAAWQVEIHTFHSWCQQILEDFPERFSARDGDIATPIEMLEVAENILKKLPLEHPLYSSDPQKYAQKLVALHKIFVDENLDPESIKEQIEAFLMNLKNDDSMYYKRKATNAHGVYQKGDYMDWKEVEKRQEYTPILAAIPLLSQVRENMTQEGLYGFSDMLQWVLDAFRSDTNFLAHHQEKHQVLFVDEFQDTSGTQYALIQELLKGQEQPDILVVGDDDQSIYRFQGANIDNVIEFTKDYPACLPPVVLTKNYRSSQILLDAAGRLIANNQNRLTKVLPELNKSLVSKNEKLSQVNNSINVLSFSTYAEERSHIITAIQELISSGVDPKEIAILYRKHRYGETFIKLLNHYKVPAQIRREENILDDPFCRDIIRVIQFVSGRLMAETDPDALLLSVISSDWWAVPHSAIIELIALQRAKRTTNPMPLWNCMDEVSAFTEIKKTLEEWICITAKEPAQEAFRSILMKSGVILEMLQRDSSWRSDILSTLLKHLESAALKKTDLRLGDWAELLKKHESYNVPISLSRIVGASEGVYCSTLHGSKGLEFSHVFIVGGSEKDLKSSSQHRGKFSMPDLSLRAQEKSDLEEDRRLFFVGATRAKTHLTISYSNENGTKNAHGFVKELAPDSHHEPEVPESVVLENESILWSNILETPPLFDANRVQDFLENKSLSPSGIGAYLNCPTAFYYQHILGIKMPTSPQFAYGTMAHNVIEWGIREQQKSGHIPTKEATDKKIYSELMKQKNAFSDEAFEKHIEEGKRKIGIFLEQTKKRWTGAIEIEKTITNTFDGVNIRGRADVILNHEDGTINVVDFKTGTPKNKLGRHHKVQLWLYWFMMNYKPTHGTIAFVAPLQGIIPWNEHKFSNKEMTKVEAILETVISGIRQNRFLPEGQNCKNKESFGSCEWCEIRETLSRNEHEATS